MIGNKKIFFCRTAGFVTAFGMPITSPPNLNNGRLHTSRASLLKLSQNSFYEPYRGNREPSIEPYAPCLFYESARRIGEQLYSISCFFTDHGNFVFFMIDVIHHGQYLPINTRP